MGLLAPDARQDPETLKSPLSLTALLTEHYQGTSTNSALELHAAQVAAFGCHLSTRSDHILTGEMEAQLSTAAYQQPVLLSVR